MQKAFVFLVAAFSSLALADMPGPHYLLWSWILREFAIALACTIAIESLVIICARQLGIISHDGKKPSLTCTLITGVIPSAITLPLFWFVLPFFVNYAILIPVGEILVALAETAMIKKIVETSWKKAFAVSVAANLASFLFGLLLIGIGVL